MLTEKQVESMLMMAGCYDIEANMNFINEYQKGVYLGTPVRDIFYNEERILHFISQIAHESAGLKRVRENTRYSRERIQQVFSKYCTSEERLDHMAQSEEFLFNTVYGNRMGNDEPGDGYRYIGRGYIMLTGKANYRKLSRDFGIGFEDKPSLLEDHRYAFYGALHYFLNRFYRGVNIFDNIDQGMTVRKVTRLINGGVHGLDDRIARYEDAKRSLEEIDYFSEEPLNSRSSREDTIKAQYMLNRMGINVGNADGWYGSKTRTGYRDFEEEHCVTASLFYIHEIFLNL